MLTIYPIIFWTISAILIVLVIIFPLPKKREEPPLDILKRSKLGWTLTTCDAGYACYIFRPGEGGYTPPRVGATGRTVDEAIERALKAIPEQ